MMKAPTHGCYIRIQCQGLPTDHLVSICGAGGGVFVALYLWENKKEEEQIFRITRDERLSRLPLRLSTGRIVELVQLRENTRPVGTSEFCPSHLSMFLLRTSDCCLVSGKKGYSLVFDDYLFGTIDLGYRWFSLAAAGGAGKGLTILLDRLL